MKKTTRLRQLLTDEKLLIAPGAYDALSAKLSSVSGVPPISPTAA